MDSLAEARPPALISEGPSASGEAGDGDALSSPEEPPHAAAQPGGGPSAAASSGAAHAGAASRPAAFMSEAVMAARSMEELAEVLEPIQRWSLASDNAQGIKRAKTYIAGADKDVLAGFFVHSINEWRVKQPRVLVLSRSAYYRVSYNAKNGKIDHYHKTPLEKLRVLEKTCAGLKVYLTEQDGAAGPKKWMGSIAGTLGLKENKRDEFEHAREYLPVVDTPSMDVAIDVIAAAFAKAAELHKASLPGATTAEVSIITTSERKQILADRAEAERLEKERIEREAATAELETAVEGATTSRDPDVLTKPLRRARRAVEVDAQLIDRATTLKAKCEEERRLERERVEREAATAELKTAISTAKQTRDAGTLARPLRRAKKAVDVDTELIGEGEGLKSELEAEKKEKERQEREAAIAAKEAARVEKERTEREAAEELLTAAIKAAQESRDAAPLGAALRRAKKAVDVPLSLIGEGEALNTEIIDEKKKKAMEAAAAAAAAAS